MKRYYCFVCQLIGVPRKGDPCGGCRKANTTLALTEASAASKANYIEQSAANTRAKQIATGGERAEAILTTTDAQKEEALAAANVILDDVLRIYQGMNILISVCGHSGQSSRSFVDECVTGSLCGSGENRKFPILMIRVVGGITYYRAPCISECRLLRVHDGGDTMVPPVVLDRRRNIVVAGYSC
jgi:hypothetical protein